MGIDEHNRGAVLTKAVLRAGAALCLTQTQVSAVLGSDAETLSAEDVITSSRAAERATLIIRITNACTSQLVEFYLAPEWADGNR